MVYTVVNTSSKRESDNPNGGQQQQPPLGFWNIDLELQAIKTILTPTSEWAAKVYSACKPEFFHHAATKAIFTRLKTLMDESKTFELPTLDFVLSDSKLSSSVRQTFKQALESDEDDEEAPVVVVDSQGDFDILIQGLLSLAKTRALYQATHKASKDLLNSEEPTQLIKHVSDQLGQSLFGMEDEELLDQITTGRNYNQAAEDAFNRIVNGSFEEAKIRSGFEEFDRRTGGFHRTNLVIISANSGGGKSLMAVNMLIRQYLLGYNTVLASYEMTSDEVLIRVLSNIAEVDMNRLQNNQLTPAETDRVTAAWREFSLAGYDKGNNYHIICPKQETTVPEIGFRARSMKPDILLLDYINLLGSSSGTQDAQWQQLGDISRDAKLLANKLNCVVILLCQLNDTYELRYSKAIKDHANFVMGWIRDDTAINTRILSIKQMKARNAPIYTWDLVERFDIAQFRDKTQIDRTVWPTADELKRLETQCQALGLKPEPTASREYDKQKFIETEMKKFEEANQVVNNISNEGDSEKTKDEEKKTEDERPPAKTTDLLFSAEDAIPADFSKLEVRASNESLLSDILIVEDTV